MCRHFGVLGVTFYLLLCKIFQELDEENSIREISREILDFGSAMSASFEAGIQPVGKGRFLHINKLSKEFAIMDVINSRTNEK